MNHKKERLLGRMVWVIILLFAAAAAAAAEKVPPKDKVAVVNGVAIKRADFESEFDAIENRIAAQGMPVPEAQREELKRRVFENMIDQELLFQESQKEKIEVRQATIDASLADIKKQFDNEADFNNALTEMNISEGALLSKIKRSLAIKELIQTHVSRKIAVSEKDSKAFFDAHPDYFKLPEKVKASHILVKLDAKADAAERRKARKKIETIQKELKKGGDFAALARKHSEGPSNVKGGELGYFSRGQMVKPFEETAFALKPGETSDVVETQFGLHLIRVTDKKPEENVEYKDAKQKIVRYLKQEKERQEIPLYIQGIREKAAIEKLL